MKGAGQAPFTCLQCRASLDETCARSSKGALMAKFRPSLSFLVLLAVSAVVVSGRGQEPAQAKADANPGPRDVIVHLFEWPWASVASECTNVLGPKGFGAVQVSPPQEHVVLPGSG